MVRRGTRGYVLEAGDTLPALGEAHADLGGRHHASAPVVGHGQPLVRVRAVLILVTHSGIYSFNAQLYLLPRARHSPPYSRYTLVAALYQWTHALLAQPAI